MSPIKSTSEAGRTGDGLVAALLPASTSAFAK
jgi:hypothetical protein